MNRVAIVIAIVLLGALHVPARAEPRAETARTKPASLPLPVPLDDMPKDTREALKHVMKAPTLTAMSPPDEFVAHADLYKWLLDRPDRTAAAWRKLGVDAIEIKQLKDGRFFWKDEGSELVWQTVAQGPNGRVWYAEGNVKPGKLLPTFPVKAVAVLTHNEKARDSGDTTIKHQVEIFLRTDSKAAALIAKVMGDSATKMAVDGSEQLLMFFSGIAKYAHDKPEKARELLAEKK